MGWPSLIHNSMAWVFLVFWAATQAQCQKSCRAYLYRTIPVCLYWAFTVPGHNRFITELEWLADGAVWYHFFSVVFLLGANMRNANG